MHYKAASVNKLESSSPWLENLHSSKYSGCLLFPYR